MRSKLWFFTLILMALTGSAISLTAQDGIPATKRSEMEERGIQSRSDDDEISYTNPKASAADSSFSKSPTTTNQNKTQKQQEVQEGEQEDVLSFNFLYYIIQKFKMSDIVDE